MTARTLLVRPVGILIVSAAFLSHPASAGIDPCAADLNGSGGVDGFDLAFLLGSWGPYAPCPPAQPADLDGNCVVDGFDLANLLGAWGASCPAGKVIETELAGNSIASYPHFQYVVAVNAGTTLEIAIDPTRFPDLVGDAVDIYLVAAKSAAQWTSDPTLTDVTGGFQSQTIAAGTIQANTFTISGGSGLSASAGDGLGVPYDVVLDVNQNGELDGGDYVDGGGDEAGFYTVHDTTLAGPYSVTELNFDIPLWATAVISGGWGGPAGFQNENIFYPSNIASLGQVPLMVVSRGNGHNHNWYDHIGNHLGSYGYVVMSHNNNTVPGIDTAAVTTLLHTDAFIENLPVIAGGVMNGHVDTSRIMWIGHSRGGEGVVRAYDRLFESTFTPQNYDINDIQLVSSICPTYFAAGIADADAHTVDYHMFYTGADGDVSGSPGGGSKPLAILERARGNKHLTYFHGAGHGDFHNGTGPSVAAGPDLIGRPATHLGLLSHLLPLVKYTLDGNPVGKEYLARMYDDFHAPGIPANVIITREYRDAAAAGAIIIDDYQTQTSTGTSSSGGAVTFSVSNATEGLMMDSDGSFVFSAGVPFNGMTRASFAADVGRCAVFDWNTAGTVNYELQIPAALQDFTAKEYLSLRAAQGTRHPETDALNAPLNFTVELRDGDGDTSAINFSNYGNITRTYLRTGSGIGAGWCNEFGTVRLRLSDFLNNGSDLDLDDVQAIRFLFGQAAGSVRGRIGLDDVELTVE